MKFTVLCPSQDEYLGVVEKFTNVFNLIYTEEDDNDLVYSHFSTRDSLHTITVYKLGIGRTLSSYNFQRILSSDYIPYMILCGVCGAITSDLKTGDVIYPNSIKMGDFFIGENNYIGFADSDYKNKRLKDTLELTNIQFEDNYKTLGCIKADIVTIDSFADTDRKNKLKELNSSGLPAIVDMETASIYSLLRYSNISSNFFVLRSVADTQTDNNSDLQEYDNTLEFAIAKVADACINLIKSLTVSNLEKQLQSLSWIKDFPKEGINFLDLQSLLKNTHLFRKVISRMSSFIKSDIDKIVALDARGFIFGSIIASKKGIPLIMARKKGKLPGNCLSTVYNKEYGEDIIQIEKYSIEPYDKVVIIDDIIVTGGTIKAACDLVNQAEATVDCAVSFATIGNDFKKILDIPVYSSVSF